MLALSLGACDSSNVTEVEAGSQSDELKALFNLENDPFESNNLAGTHPKKLRDMMQKLITSLDDHGALYPISKDKDGAPMRPQLP